MLFTLEKTEQEDKQDEQQTNFEEGSRTLTGNGKGHRICQENRFCHRKSEVGTSSRSGAMKEEDRGKGERKDPERALGTSEGKGNGESGCKTLVGEFDEGSSWNSRCQRWVPQAHLPRPE